MISKILRLFHDSDKMSEFFHDLQTLTYHFDGDSPTLADIKDRNFLIDEVIGYLEELKQ